MIARRGSAYLILLVLGACGDTSPQPDGTPRRAVDPGIALIDAALPGFVAARGRRFPAMTPTVKTAYGLISSRRYAEARELLAAQVPPTDQGDFFVGLADAQEKRWASALPHFERVLRRGPTFGASDSAFYLYGQALMHLGRIDAAEHAYRAHLQLKPDQADTLFSLGLLCIERDALDEASDLLERALEAFRDKDRGGSQSRHIAKTHARLGDVRVLQGRLEEARDAFRECIRIHPQHVEPHYKLSRVLTRLGDEDGARRALADFRSRRALR